MWFDFPRPQVPDFPVKRLTDTDKWLDPWFQELPFDAKLAWLYLLDRCDNAGVWEPNKRLANFTLGREMDWAALEQQFVSSGRLLVLGDGKWQLTKFIAFQYGKLSEECAPHRQVLRLIEKHRIHVNSLLSTDSRESVKPLNNPLVSEPAQSA